MAEKPDGGSVKGRIATRFLTPIAAAAASAAAGVVVKKGPDYFERVLLPRLRELAGEAGNATHDLPSKAASVASGAGDVVQDLGDRAKSFVGSGEQTTSNGNQHGRSPQELEQRRQERAQSRAERRKASGR
jgi:hypothetical protein